MKPKPLTSGVTFFSYENETPDFGGSYARFAYTHYRECGVFSPPFHGGVLARGMLNLSLCLRRTRILPLNRLPTSAYLAPEVPDFGGSCLRFGDCFSLLTEVPDFGDYFFLL